MLSRQQGHRENLLRLACFAIAIVCAVHSVRCQVGQAHSSAHGVAQLVAITTEDLSVLIESNDTDIDNSLPGTLGVHNRKLLTTCPAQSSNTPNYVSIAAGCFTSFSYNDMNEVGFSITQQDGSSFSLRVISSDGTQTVTFPNNYWGQSWSCVQQAVLKYTNCPGTWTVEVACDNANTACDLYYSITAQNDYSTCTSPPPPPVATQAYPPPPPPPSSSESCQCTCCAGNDCTASLVGSYNAASAAKCTVSSCIQAYPEDCPSEGASGTASVLYVAADPTSSSSGSTYTTASGTIALDTTSVTDSCKSVSFYQCVQAYAVSASGSTFTLTSTSGTADDCGTGVATLQDDGAEGTGTFSDGTTFSATNSGTYISVNVDNGTCVGDYYVKSGGPILGVDSESSSGSPAFAMVPLAAVIAVAAMAFSMLT